MNNKTKSWSLLIVFSLSLVPFGGGQAEDPARSMEEARSLLYLGDAFLEEEANLDTAAHFPGLLAPVSGVRSAEGAEEVMDRMIHAAKQERNDLDANCRMLTAKYQQSGGEEAVHKLRVYCESERERLTNRISLLRRLRGDRRKMFTRLWHSLKRDAGNLWSRIGPVGRNILRRVGDEAFEVVASGGTLSGGGIKRLLKQAVKTTAREELKRTAVQGMERLLQGQVKIARAAGVLDDDSGENGPHFLEGDADQVDNNLLSEGEVQESTDGQDEGEVDCPGDSSWVAPFWDEAIQPRLIAEGRTCQQTATAIYKSCLQDQGIQGVCPEEALEQCDHLYRAIPRTETSGAVTQNLTVMHSEAENVSASLVYNGSGSGGVQGEISYVLKDSHLCTITVSSTLSGSFDLGTCTLSGTAQVTEVYAGAACASVCSADTCPVTRSASVPWQATLEDGKISGGVNGNSSSVSGFGFGTP